MRATTNGFWKRAGPRRLGAVELVVESDPNAEEFYRAMGAERVGTVLSIVDPEC